MAYAKKDSGTTTEKKTTKVVENNAEMAELRSAVEALKAQNELLMKMLMSQNAAQPAQQPKNSLDEAYTLVHLIECAPGLNTHIELTNTTIDMSVFGEERILDRRQCEEISGKYRKFFEKGIIAFGAGSEELADKLGLQTVKNYSYFNKNFVKQLGGLSTLELESLWGKLASGHKKFVVEYFKRKILAGDPAFKDIHKVELLNRLSGGAMSGTTLDFQREAEEAAKKKNNY